MKCLVLAGGRGERLWPLSRKNYPKQFIQIQKNHSVFQATIARNIPFCDEFVIVTSFEYRFMIENQMKAFQGTPYRCIYEDEPMKTTAAIALTCLGLRPSEFVFVVAADQIIDSSAETVGENKGYKDAILQAKDYARDGAITLFCKKETDFNKRFGYVTGVQKDGQVSGFIEKPDEEFALNNDFSDELYRNLGMILFQNGVFQKELARLEPEIWDQCRKAYKYRRMQKSHTFYPAEVLNNITPLPIGRSVIEKTNCLRAVMVSFGWKHIGRLEDIHTEDCATAGVSVINDCSNAIVINNAPRQALVLDGVDDAVVVNTPDAVYIGRNGKSSEMKELFKKYPELHPYTEKGTMFYRGWGYYEQLVEEKTYRIRQVTILPGKTIYSHKHTHRIENWTIVNGQALITTDGNSKIYGISDNIDISIGMDHQISNIGDDALVIVETAIGDIVHDSDMISKPLEDLVESQIGLHHDPMVKLEPAFKDSLWGGTKLRTIYGMNCDYDVIAESWQLSAHPAGQSIIATGKHKGLTFSDYLAAIGKDALGWKCSPLQSFPILIKFIDAQSDLSVQVHPDDDYALEIENQYGKNEMWYVIDSDPGSGLFVGFNRDVTREEVERRVKDNTIVEVMNFYPTKPGDVFFIPAGTVHAIGAGNLICEIQQSSNLTYRLYDYGRVDKFGNPRELHMEKALDVLNYHKYEPTIHESGDGEDGILLTRCKYFESVAYDIHDEWKLQLNSDKFYSIVCISGAGTLTLNDTQLPIKAGECIFIPAIDGVITANGDLFVVVSHI